MIDPYMSHICHLIVFIHALTFLSLASDKMKCTFGYKLGCVILYPTRSLTPHAMERPVREAGATEVFYLIKAIMAIGRITIDWQESYINSS